MWLHILRANGSANKRKVVSVIRCTFNATDVLNGLFRGVHKHGAPVLFFCHTCWRVQERLSMFL